MKHVSALPLTQIVDLVRERGGGKDSNRTYRPSRLPCLARGTAARQPGPTDTLSGRAAQDGRPRSHQPRVPRKPPPFVLKTPSQRPPSCSRLTSSKQQLSHHSENIRDSKTEPYAHRKIPNRMVLQETTMARLGRGPGHANGGGQRSYKRYR